MAAYREVPKHVEAVQFLRWDGKTPVFSESPQWILDGLAKGKLENGSIGTTDGYLSLMTRAWYSFLVPTDWIIKMPDCDLFSAHDDVFKRLYEPVPDQGDIT